MSVTVGGASLAESDAHASFVRGPETAGTQDTGTSSANAAPASHQEGAAPAGDASAAAPAATQQAAQQAGQQAASAARAEGATPAQQEAARQTAIQAMLDGKPFEIDPRLQLPYRRGNETVYFPVSEAIRFHMNHRDYTSGKQRLEQRESEFARQQREVEVQRRAFEARQQAFQEEQDRFMKAYSGDDPEEAERYRRHIENMRDPDYRRMYEDSIAKRERDAVDEMESELTRYDESQSVAQDVSAFIRDFGSRNFPGIEPEMVQQLYGEALSNGTLKWPAAEGRALDDALRTLVPQQVRQLFQQEAERRARYTAPVMSELEQLRQKVAQLEGGRTADDHNARTRTAISRSRNPVGAPAAGNPPAPGGRRSPEPFTSDKLEEKKNAWARGG